MNRIARLLPVFWGLNILTWCGVVLWLILDARFEAAVDWWKYQAGSPDLRVIRDMGDWQQLEFRGWCSFLIGIGVIFSALLMALAYFIGPASARTIRTWALYCLVFGMWSTLFLNWRDIAWTGKQIRLSPLIAHLDRIAADLDGNWPIRDGEHSDLGPYMAYPASRPRTLILLELPELGNSSTTVAAVEKGDKTIRLELAGREFGDWIEKHVGNQTPHSFVSGIGEVYQLERFQRVSGDWYLVRYQ